MSQRRQQSSHRLSKWLNAPVAVHEGTLADIRQHIPSFERRDFGLVQPGGQRRVLNASLDMIVRLPFKHDADFVPLGVVSKAYVLVPHTSVLDIASSVMDRAGIPKRDVNATLRITEHGERMHLSLFMPDEYAFNPGDGHPMALRLECMNSVDGTTGFRALMGWFRFVCENGMVVGVTRNDLRRRHLGGLRIEDIGQAFQSGLEEAEEEKRNFMEWRKSKLTTDALEPWVNKALKEAWGFKAAARTFHIARSGHDVEIVGPYNGAKPTTIAVRKADRVPGCPSRCENRFDLSQILAWLAKERRDLQEQLVWREQIPAILHSLN